MAIAASCGSLNALTLGLPTRAAVPDAKGALPKQMFIGRGAVSAKTKQRFATDIESISMLAILRPATTDLAESRRFPEILVLGLHTDGKPAAGYFPCTGQHGGRVIFRGDVSAIRFPDQVTPHPPTEEETALLRPLVERWCALFGGDAEALMGGPFTVVTPDSKNPYRQMYAAN